MEEAHNSNPRKPGNQATDEHASRVLSDNYVVIGQLSESDLSTVDIIREVSTGRHLLAKTVRGTSDVVQERFHAAILDHGRLQHENIAQTVDWRISDDGRPVFITEFLEGISLTELIDEVGTLEDDDEITTFLFQLCDALEYAHSQGIIHGGLKPSNVVITKPEDDIIVKVLDFGATNRTRELPEHAEIAGSAYLSPEQRIGKTTVKSDVFSLAAMAYQLITGYLPFLKIDDGRVLDEAAEELAPIFDYRPDIPAADKLGEVLAQALIWNPARRTPTVEDFRKGVATWYQSIGGSDGEESGEYYYEEEEEVDLGNADYYAQDITKEPVPPVQPSPAVASKPAVAVDEIDDSDFGEYYQETDETEYESEEYESEDAASEPVSDSDNEPVSAIGIIVKPQDRERKQPGDPGYDEFEDIDDLDDLDDLDSADETDLDREDETVVSPPQSKSHTQTGFGADIADDEFGVVDADDDFPAPGSEAIGNTPSFPSPGAESDQARKLAEIDKGKAEFTIPPDQEHSGRFSRVARLPAMQAIPGMEASVVAPPKKPAKGEPKVKLEQDIEHEKEKETIKKFKKPPKRHKSKLDSTMTKLMALRSNIVEQELTVSTKFVETFAQTGPRQSPKKVIIRIVASVVIFIASTIMIVANMDILKSVWTVTSRTLSSALLKKPQDDVTANGAIETVVEDESTQKKRVAAKNKAPNAAVQTASAVNPNAPPPLGGKHQTHIMYVPRVIDSRNIAPRTITPGSRSYKGVVYPYLFTEESAARDPKQPRPTDSPVKEVTGQ